MLKNIVGNLAKGIASGIMIAIGCAVYAASENKTVGAVLFSVALLTICFLGFNLYTGKIGFIIEKHGLPEIIELVLALIGNEIGVTLAGLLIRLAIPSLGTTAEAMCAAKLGQEFYQTLIRGIFCGVLMYVAVAIFKEKKSSLGVLFAIPVFILSGFEHSIADMGYFGMAGVFSLESLGFVWTVILGNTLGAWILPLLKKLWTVKEPEIKTEPEVKGEEG